MLSNQSGFTQGSEDEFPMISRDMKGLIERERQRSDGSSGAGSGTSDSVGDPKSPVTGKRMMTRWDSANAAAWDEKR